MKRTIIFFAILILAAAINISCKKTIIDSSWDKAEPYTYELIYDESHANVWGIWDTGFTGYSNLALAMRERGILVSNNIKPLNELIKGLPEKNISRTILFLGFAKRQLYSEDEIQAVKGFVEKGGKLIVLGEPRNIYDIYLFQNPMLSSFDMKIDNDLHNNAFELSREELETRPMDTNNCPAFSKAFGLEKVVVVASVTVWCMDDCATLLETQHDGVDHTIGVGKKIGNGKVVLLGNSHFLINGDKILGINRDQNKEFFINCVEWILGKRLPTVEPAEASLKPESGKAKKTVFIDQSSWGLNIDDSRSGLKAFAQELTGAGFNVISANEADSYDVRIVAGPLSKIIPEKDKAKKLILFADSFMQLQRFSTWGKSYLMLKAQNPEPVYTDIEKAYSISVQPCFITDAGISGNPYSAVIDFMGNKMRLQRAAAIDFKGAEKKWSLDSNKIWGELYHPGVERENMNSVPEFDDKNDLKNPTWMAYDKNLFLAGDCDIISNVNKDEKYFKDLVKVIVEWIGQ